MNTDKGRTSGGSGALPGKGEVLSVREVDALVHAVQMRALAIGQIPIAGVVSREVRRGRHELLGYGHNLLRSGVPGIHGETGAIIQTGRLEEGGWGGVTLTSSLNPCQFCQRLMCLHLGIRRVRILDSENLEVEGRGFREAGVRPVRLQHRKVAGLFGAWVREARNKTVWDRDIGLYEVPTGRPWDAEGDREGLRRVLGLGADVARRVWEASGGEVPPVAAVMVDAWGEVLSVGHSRIVLDNDPTATASMVAWRNAGARDHWKDKTLVLVGCGPDEVACAMMEVFQLGQIVVTREGAEGMPLGLGGLRRSVPGARGGRVRVVEGGDGGEGGEAVARMVGEYLRSMPEARLKEEFGAGFGK